MLEPNFEEADGLGKMPKNGPIFFILIKIISVNLNFSDPIGSGFIDLITPEFRKSFESNQTFRIQLI